MKQRSIKSLSGKERHQGTRGGAELEKQSYNERRSADSSRLLWFCFDRTDIFLNGRERDRERGERGGEKDWEGMRERGRGL